KCLTPLWQKNPIEILEEIVNLKFHVIITGVYAFGFNREWLGRKINKEAIEALKELSRQYGVSIVGEGGEYETLVLDAPFFKKRIKVIAAEKVWKNQSGYLIITKAELENK
ncbi:MAG: diphthine--ammonia ligase, partial [Candidatus Bathyarchaeia archaeon]